MPDTREPRSVVDAAEQAAAAGDYASAERLLREAASLQEATLGPLHPDLANTLNNLGVVCEITHKPADAERCFRRAYEIATAVLEPGHPFVATSRKNLEDFCAARGETVDAPTPPPAVDVQVDARQTESVAVAPQRSTYEEPRPAVARPSSRPFAIGALLAGGLLVTLLATAVWLRSNDEPESSAGTPSAPPAESPATTAAPKPIEPKRVEPKPTDVPKAIAPARTAPASPSRSTAAPVPKSPLVVVDVQLCRDLRTGGPVAGGWRCDPAGSPIAPGRLLFYTRLKSPTATTVQHRWYRGDRLQQAVELTIRANTRSGYRTYSRNTVSASGDWRVELRTRDGVLLHEERFIVR
jgi:hypothetical protein